MNYTKYNTNPDNPNTYIEVFQIERGYWISRAIIVEDGDEIIIDDCLRLSEDEAVAALEEQLRHVQYDEPCGCCSRDCETCPGCRMYESWVVHCDQASQFGFC